LSSESVPGAPRGAPGEAAAAGRSARPAAGGGARERIARLEAEARQLHALAALGAVAAELAHELRNPLVALESFLELLPERRGDPELETRFLAVAVGELRRATRLLDAMVELRRARGPLGQPGAAAPAVEAVALLLGSRARTRGVALETRVEPGLPATALGADALRQVLLNLALNAIDASPRGGRVRIAARSTRGGVELAVADQGRGLDGAPQADRPPAGPRPAQPPQTEPQASGGGPADRQPRPSAPRGGAPPRPAQPSGGERAGRPGGLGLAITRRIVEEAGGSLDFGEAPGGGAELRAWVPRIA
jgi:signal transduction histidine kinase